MSLKDREISRRPSFRHGLTELKVILRRSKLPERSRLQALGQRGKRRIDQAVAHLTSHVCQREHAARFDKKWTDSLVVTPHDVSERSTVRPVQTLDSQV